MELHELMTLVPKCSVSLSQSPFCFQLSGKDLARLLPIGVMD